MKTTQKIIFIGIILPLLFIGCTGNPSIDEMKQDTPTVGIQPLETRINTATVTPTRKISEIIEPTKTLRPTGFSLPTEDNDSSQNTVQPEATDPTYTATETRQTKLDKLQKFLDTNGGCDLPCVWGFTPGESTWADTIKIIERLVPTIHSSSSRGFEKEFAKYFSWMDVHSFNFYFAQDNGHISIVDIEATDIYGMTEFHQLWTAYSPQKILDKYGKPTNILLFTTVEYGDQGNGKYGYMLWLDYSSSGFLLRYDGFVKNTEILQICPQITDGGQIIEIEVISAQTGIDAKSLDPVLQDANTRPIRPFTEATGISYEELMDSAQNDQSSFCFTSPKSYWLK